VIRLSLQEIFLNNLAIFFWSCYIEKVLKIKHSSRDSSVGSSRGLKILVSAVQVRLLAFKIIKIMDEIIKKIAALGLPGIILVIVMATTGLTGTAAITTALAILGGPTGILGGLVVLGVTGLISETLAQISLEDFLIAIYCQRRQTEPQGKLIAEIDSLSLVDPQMKARLKTCVTDGCGCSTTVENHLSETTQRAIAILEQVPGITKASPRDFDYSQPIIRLNDGSSLRTWKNLLGIDHVFLANRDEYMIYGGYVGWDHSEDLKRAISLIQTELT
jgi:hypothetical protein